tara:strand:- start:3365 stop:3652 length:288 start_codon:yes stop_codon:yes gene_type:complete
MTPDHRNDTKIDKSSGFLSGLIALKLICCGGLILLATGGLAGLGAWFSGVSIVIAAGMALAVFAILLIRRQIASRQDSSLYEARPVRASLGEDGP